MASKSPLKNSGTRSSGPSLIFPPGKTLITENLHQGGNQPDKHVREANQNSLDASADINAKASVTYAVEEVPVSDMPNGFLEECESVLDQIIAGYKNSESYVKKAKRVCDRIKKSYEKLRAEGKVRVLYTIDNGCGLSRHRINKLLIGGSAKKEDGGELGSHGEGHMAAFSASDIRCVFYGSIGKLNPNDKFNSRMCAGRVILGSHMRNDGHKVGEKGEPEYRADRDGFWAVEYDEKLDDSCTPVTDDLQIPKFMRRKLDELKCNPGTVIAIIGFNDFREDRPGNFNLEREVFRVSALNFFPAILGDKMEVTVQPQSGKVHALNKGNLQEVIYQHEENAKAAVSGFPNGKKAFKFHKTIIDGDKHNVPDPKVKIHILKDDECDKTWAMIRDGMFITCDIPGIKESDFLSKEPFNFVLELNKDSCERYFYRMVSDIESGSHTELDIKELEKEEQAALKQKFENVAEFIKHELNDQRKPRGTTGFLTLNPGAADGKINSILVHEAGKGKENAFRNNVRKNHDNKGGGKKNGGGIAGNKPVRQRLPKVKMFAHQISPGNMKIAVSPELSCEDVKIRLSVDVGRNIRDDEDLSDMDWGKIEIMGAKLSGLSSGELLDVDETREYISLGKLVAGRRLTMEISYTPPKIKFPHNIIAEISGSATVKKRTSSKISQKEIGK